MNLLRRAGGDTSGTCQYEMGLLELLQCTAALDGLCLSFQGIGDCLLFAILCPRCLSRLREARCRILGARQLESESRVRAHVFLCMLAYYVEWHLREALKPLLHDDEELAVLRDQRVNPVMPTPRSEGASAKAARHRTDDDLPVHSLHTLLQDLGTLTYNITSTPVNPQAKIVITTRPTPLQSKAFALLGIDPACSQ